MRIVNKLTLRHLKANKGRTAITALGVCISVAMITAVFVAIASFLNLFVDISVMLDGDSVLQIASVDKRQIEILKSDERIDTVGLFAMKSINYQLENRESDKLGTGSMLVSDTNNSKLIFTGKYDGEIPKNSGEIAVEQSFIDDNSLDWKLGDTVTVPIDERASLSDDEISSDEYSKNEKLNFSENRQFKITAIMHNNYATYQYCSIICGFDDSEPFSSACARIKLKELNSNSLNVVYDIMNEVGVTRESCSVNNEILDCYFAYDDGGSFAALLPMIATILIIIVIASVALIYNAFAMSLSERVRYLGMLASVGATKRQKRGSIYFEGFLFGLIGIPLGIGAGILGISVTLKYIGNQIIGTAMIRGLQDNDLTINTVVPLWTIICIIIFSVLTIFIASVVPAVKASKITPIDAIRQRQEIKAKPHKLKTPFFIRKIFGYEGELAHKSIKRNGRKSRVITISIALSVILFLSCNYFCQIFLSAANLEEEIPYKIQVSVEYESKDKLNDILDSTSGIDDYYCTSSGYFRVGGKIDGFDDLTNSDHLTNAYKNIFNSTCQVFINLLDDDKFNDLCKSNGIDYNDYYGKELNALVMNNISHNAGGGKVFNDSIIGAKISSFSENDFGADFTVTGEIKYDGSKVACKLNPQKSISFYVPYSAYYNCVSDDIKQNLVYLAGIETKAHSDVKKELKKALEAFDFQTVTVYDLAEQFQTMNTVVYIIEVFVYGFVALITLITIANIINTISTGIAARKKEFAMLKSVGVTPKGFNKMIMLESSLYGIKALIFALPISILLSFLMNQSIAQNTIPFIINRRLYLIVIAVVFAIICLTMIYSVNKTKKDTIVETLKEDII